MYQIQPLPTLAPSSITGYQAMEDITTNIFNKIVVFLKSVPVIPNPEGYFDPVNGRWLAPTVSFFDVLVGLVLVAITFGIFFRLSSISNVGGAVGGLLKK